MTKTRLTKFFWLCLLLIGLIPVNAEAWTQFSLNLANCSLLTTAEMTQGTALNFGVKIADDGTLSRVEATATDADIILTGTYHDSQHGWTGMTAKTKTDSGINIGLGNCTYGSHTATITDGTNTTSVTTTAECWASGTPTEKVTYQKFLPTAGSTTTITGAGYTPYISIEKVAASNISITYSLGTAITEGVVPSTVTLVSGAEYTIPVNHTLYCKGKTLTAWTDGTNNYTPGSTITAPTKDVTLTPVFTDNTVTLADRTEATTLTWDFQRVNGAPNLAYQNKPGIYVTQATVKGSTIDVKLDFTTSPGKINNTNNTDWCQINSGTTFTIPSAKGAVVSTQAYSTITTTTIDGQSDYTQGTDISYTIASASDSIKIVIGDGSYYRFIKTVLPLVEAKGVSFDNANANVTWAFTGSATDPATVTPDGAFSLSAFSAGTEIGNTSSATYDGVSYTRFQPTVQASAASANNELVFKVTPAKGITFTPTKVSALVRRFGTDGGLINVSARNDEGKNVILATGMIPARNKVGSNGVASFEFNIADSLATSKGFALVVNLYNLGNTKQFGISNIQIDGTVNGTKEEVAQYTLATKTNLEGAGTVSVYPKGDKFDDGTELTVTATKNFGYKFNNWTDADGNVVSQESKYTFTLKANTTLTANFEKINTYALDLTVASPANSYMVQASPAATVVEGKNMYEDGTTVTLTASSNPIMTFTGWSNGETAGEIKVNMTGNVALTANYSAIDYIAGWDFYKAGGNGRIADFYAADNDVDQLVLRNADGTNVAWLDKNQESAGGYEGKPAAVNWRNDAAIGTYYWQVKVNAANFTDIKVSADMMYNYNGYQKQDVDYSIDNVNWTNLGSINIPGVKNWTNGTFTLPAAANNQATLYIRWKSDTSSTLDGTTSTNDGIAISNIFVTGTEKPVDDGKAPVLVSSVPAEGSTTASANGKVVLTFDEKVKLAESATATIGTQKLTPTVSGKSIIMEYKGLSYATAYVFTLPANSISDLTGNFIDKDITVNFTTKNKPTIAKALYDFIIPDNGDFKAAITAAAKRTDTSVRYRIFVKAGSYTIPVDSSVTVTGSDGVAYPSATTVINTPNVSIVGENMDEVTFVNTVPTNLIAGTYGPANPIEGIGKGDVLQLNSGATNTYFQDVTLKSGMADNTGRNIVLNDKSNKTICKDVCLYAYQDTYVSNNENSRFYFEGGRLRGRTDFLCGKGDVYYNGVDLVMCANGYLAVPSKPTQYGYIFKDCVIKGEVEGLDGNYTLGRPWGQGTPIALFIDTKMEIKPSAIGWSEMSGGWPARFAEYNSYTTTGTSVDLTARKTTFADTHTNNPVLTAEEAAVPTLTTVMGGSDDWDPTAYTEQASAPTNVKLSNNTLTWDNNDYVLCWAVCKNGKVIYFTTTASYSVDDTTATWSVRAANEMGGLGDATTISGTATGINNIVVKSNSDTIYNLSGMRIQQTAKGINIVNGKKVIK